MWRKSTIIAMAVLAIALAAGLFISCEKQESPVGIQENQENLGQTGNSEVGDSTGWYGLKENPSVICSPSSWPQSMVGFKWPVVSGQKVKIYAGYGPGGGSSYHQGADYHAVDLHNGDNPSATRWMWVTNPAMGEVMEIGTNQYSSYGYYVKMNHHNGWISMVCHLQTNPENFIAVGNTLLQGTFLGYTGSSGWATGPHIHFVIRRYGVSQPLSGIDGDANIVINGIYTSSNVYVPPPFGIP